VIGKREQKQEHDGELSVQIPFSRKIKWLGNLLWGGSALLAFEHVWHGEVVPFFPFLTAMSDPGETATMLHEMGTIGVGMAALVTIAWGVMCFAADRIVRRSDAQEGMPLMQKEGR
jgi:hypothetical protein